MIGKVKELIPKMLNLDNDKVYELKEYKQKRSLDANAYYWKLVNEISNVLRTSSDEVHLQMLRDYGQSRVAILPSKIDLKVYLSGARCLVMKDISKLNKPCDRLSELTQKEVDLKGFAKYYDEERKFEVKGKEFTEFKIYKGSSEMDTKEMSILIDGVVYEAKQLGIETLEDLIIKEIKDKWKR